MSDERVDASTPTWRIVSLHCRAQIELLRDQLERANNFGEGEQLRGQIIALRKLLALAAPDLVTKSFSTVESFAQKTLPKGDGSGY